MPVAAPALRPDVDLLLHERLLGAAPLPRALPRPRPLEVDGVLGGQLLGALDEGGRLVLVVGALGLGEQLADPVDQPLVAGVVVVAGGLRRGAHRLPPRRRARP